MTRLWRIHMGVLLIGLLLVSRLSCESSVVDDEDDDEEAMDESETSGSGPGTSDDTSSSSADTAERPDVNTYRDDQTNNRNSNSNSNNNHQNYEETTAESNSFQDADDAENDSESLDDELNDEYNGDQSKSDSPASEQKPAAPNAGGSGQQQLFTYQNNRSKLLNIIKKPGILAGIVGGAIIGILTAILLIMFIVYRMRKKDEGSYALEETKKPLNAYDYRHCPTKEFYA